MKGSSGATANNQEPSTYSDDHLRPKGVVDQRNMKDCTVNKKNHNLNLQMYSFTELLNLFHLDDVSTLSDAKMKAAKMMVLKMHPDKSRLPPDYFLFYKKAFDIVLEFYRQQQRVDQPLPKEEIQYIPSTRHSVPKVAATIEKMDKGEFHDKFNQLFEDNMLNKTKQQDAATRLQWFTQEDPLYAGIEMLNGNGGAIHRNMESLKQQQQPQHLAKYQGVQTLYSRGGNAFYEDEDNEDADYIHVDPFSKLKFDDLRKVHKDQTVIPVSESDLQHTHAYGSVEELSRARSQQNVAPMDRAQSVRHLAQHAQVHQDQIARKEYHAKLQSIEYHDKSKTVLSHFLRLEN